MTKTEIREKAAAFCAFRLTRGQQTMIEDGCPPSLIRDPEAPRARNLESTMKTEAKTDPNAIASALAIIKPKGLDAAVKQVTAAGPKAPPPAPKAARAKADRDLAARQARKGKKPTPVKKVAAPPKKVAKPTAPKKEKAARKGVPAQAIADFMAERKVVTMAELVKKFGIEPHPMRAKVFYVRHTLGYDVVTKDDGYHTKAPKK